MSHSPSKIIGIALNAYIERNAKPFANRVASDPFEIDIALCCVKLGDVSALGLWINKLEHAAQTSSAAGFEELLTALKHLSARWIEIDSKEGVGALLDYRYCLERSPPHVVGQDRIDNARRFQLTRNRVPGDPWWAFEIGID